MKEFDHIRIVTNEPRDGESWVPFSKVWVTNLRLHPQRIEYIRPAEMPDVDPADIGLWKLWNLPHIAYRVDDLAEEIKDQEVILDPFEPDDFATIAFVHKDGVVVEYLEYRDLNVWFGQETPWHPVGPAPRDQ